MQRPEPSGITGPAVHNLTPADLVLMDTRQPACDFRIALAYASNENLLFGEAIYAPQARLSLHRDLADIVCAASRAATALSLRLVLYDGLRTVEAQEKMLRTRRARENPHWLEEPRLLSPPGAGGHPRGMAIDLSLETMDGGLLDMGTPFDDLAAKPGPADNPAHRAYTRLPAVPLENRRLLERLMLAAADSLNTPLLPLPQEWWDFRLPAEIYNRYAPLSEVDLPPALRMLG